jgi:hypothetical protein
MLSATIICIESINILLYYDMYLSHLVKIDMLK